MYVEKFKNNGIDYLRLVSSFRTTDQRGRKVARKKVEKNIGPLSRFDDGQPDFFQRLKESFRAGDPLIPSLQPFVQSSATEETRSLLFQMGSSDCTGHPKYVSHMLLDPIFSSLGLSSLFATIKHQSKLTYDLQGLVRLLVFGRLLDPSSKYATARQSQDYDPPVVEESYPYHLYDALDVIQEHKEKIIRRMNTSIVKGLGRKTDLIFYDVTNFYFETGTADEREEEEEEEEAEAQERTDGGNAGEECVGNKAHAENTTCSKGIRQFGVSKEQRKQPLVQMGLFLDEMGIPISVELFPGNTLDQATLRPALERSIDKLGYPRFILVADRGLCSYKNALHLLQGKHGYILSKSIKRSKQQERKWMLQTEGYIQKSEEFKYKSKVIQRREKDAQGQEHLFEEQQIVYWSKKFYQREVHEHQSFLALIDKLKQNPSSFRVSKAQNRSLQRFLKKDVVNKNTGELLDSRELLAQIDEEKLEEFTDLMGYYQIVTSEVQMDPLEVIDKYHGLTRIEDQFRVMKGDLKTRPMFVRTQEHIEAHLLICLIALVLLRIIQHRLVMREGKTLLHSKTWTYAMSADRVQRALRKWKIDALPEGYYRFCDVEDEDVAKLLSAFDIHIPRKFFTRGEIQTMKSSIQVFL